MTQRGLMGDQLSDQLPEANATRTLFKRVSRLPAPNLLNVIRLAGARTPIPSDVQLDEPAVVHGGPTSLKPRGFLPAVRLRVASTL